eukprot:3932772-Rhodomonas_salina.1
MDPFQNLNVSMNSNDQTVTITESRHAECTEEAANQPANCHSSAPIPTTESGSSSPQSEDASEGISERKNNRPWTKDEHERFLVALERFRTNKTEKVKKNGKQTTGLGPGIADVIALIVKTRDAAQCTSRHSLQCGRPKPEASGQRCRGSNEAQQACQVSPSPPSPSCGPASFLWPRLRQAGLLALGGKGVGSGFKGTLSSGVGTLVVRLSGCGKAAGGSDAYLDTERRGRRGRWRRLSGSGCSGLAVDQL